MYVSSYISLVKNQLKVSKIDNVRDTRRTFERDKK